jgi:hypothetical protein
MDLVDQLVNDEGLKFTVTLNITPETYVKLFAVIAASVIISGFGLILMQNAIKK